MEATLRRTVQFLAGESYMTRNMSQHIQHMDTNGQLQLLRQLLCIRSPEYFLPKDICLDIEKILLFERNHRTLVSADSIPTFAITTPSPSRITPIKIKLWRGDITTLQNVTVITNAANTQMLGCFQPKHKCIDNVIHSWAGPQLRQQCYDMMNERGGHLPTGLAMKTDAFCLPCEYIIHTVGPQIQPNTEPTELECQQLQRCYISVLNEMKRVSSNGLKTATSIALCGISTGLFAFPTRIAAKIAVEAVASWIHNHPTCIITELIFVTYTETDEQLYTDVLSEPRGEWTMQPYSTPESCLSISCLSLSKASQFLLDADTIIVTAGAGLSAAAGLDYTSKALFQYHFPTFLQYGFTCLYDVFGFTDWPSEELRWSYFTTHLEMVRNWPMSELYAELIEWLRCFEGQRGNHAHVRTSNADGLFVANGWNGKKMSTPQGQYALLQCAVNCTPDSYWPAASYLDAARASMDPKTQRLSDSRAVPACKNCGGDMFICVRAADWFNGKPYCKGEALWQKVKRRALNGEGRTTILEIGVGMNTPGVLKWPNEELVRKGRGKVKLVRLGLGLHSIVPWGLEEEGLATYIDGDIKFTLPMLLRSTQ